MTKVAIVGCGVVGAAIAYELSQVPGLTITLIDERVPASGSTSAALGILMGAISHKTKGRAWRLRQASLERYETLIPELEALTGHKIPFNRHGIVMLCFAEEELGKWQKLAKIRHSQGYELEIWNREQLQAKCPYIQNEKIVAAIYSRCDRQVNPTLLTQALVAGAIKNGVNCQFEVKIQNFAFSNLDDSNLQYCDRILLKQTKLDTDWLVISAGLGSTPLTASLASALAVRPVLGQALQIKLERSLGDRDFQPVITGNDVHIVPINEGEYWVGATVEFPSHGEEFISEPALLETVKQEAISFYPSLAEATIVRTWSGKRPRPEGVSAPIIGRLSGYSNILLATGHYRNGVLLAPATALAIKEMIF
ncbi:MAG: FAD-binding oxidoreductase [Hydrococcus sp. RM1_1_31]|nr:FAD-binding oxidoreductase [Hydrococcus sp. RM1_1_31]